VASVLNPIDFENFRN